MRISDWSSDVCSSDLRRRLLLSRIAGVAGRHVGADRAGSGRERDAIALRARDRHAARVIERGLADLARSGKNALDLLGGEPGTVVHAVLDRPDRGRSEEHTSELQSLMRISYAVFCFK